VLIPAAAAMCFMPLTVEPMPISYNTEIFGSFYNYSHPAVHQLFEIRYLPVTAFVLFCASWCVLQLAKTDAVEWSKILFSAGAGAIGFSFFRLILLRVYSDHLAWFGFWEEITEWLFIAGVCCALWIFRLGLLQKTEPKF